MVTTHPKDLPFVIFRDLHILDTDDLLVCKHPLVLGWELLSGFSGLLFVPVLFLAIAVRH